MSLYETDGDTIIERSSPPVILAPTAEAKPKLKSWRKKYRKMQLVFKETMKESDYLFGEEQKACETSRRLAQQNDQLLELLLDLNSSAHIPPEQRFDLGSPDVDIEPLEAQKTDVIDLTLLSSSPHASSNIKDRPTKLGAKIDDSSTATKSNGVLEPAHTSARRSLQSLLDIPHTRLSHLREDETPEELRQSPPPPPTYLTPAQEDEYLYTWDCALGEPQLSSSKTRRPPTAIIEPSPPGDSVARNPMSVCVWLRRCHPNVFLQDREGTPEKTGTKSSRGAGKRAAAAAAAAAAAVDGSAMGTATAAKTSKASHLTLLGPSEKGGGGKTSRGGSKKAADATATATTMPSTGTATKRKRASPPNKESVDLETGKPSKPADAADKPSRGPRAGASTSTSTGKRKRAATVDDPSKHSLDLDEGREMMMGFARDSLPDPSTAAASSKATGKRKRDDDDAGYRPKGGSGKTSTKRKRDRDRERERERGREREKQMADKGGGLRDREEDAELEPEPEAAPAPAKKARRSAGHAAVAPATATVPATPAPAVISLSSSS
ncbi:MAG: hypothetical protein M1826_006401 [Phylliscum demangeonii]|nr:MAG: hypothetical protein M1826_006401 [Phylliscum demangeonii]